MKMKFKITVVGTTIVDKIIEADGFSSSGMEGQGLHWSFWNMIDGKEVGFMWLPKGRTVIEEIK